MFVLKEIERVICCDIHLTTWSQEDDLYWIVLIWQNTNTFSCFEYKQYFVLFCFHVVLIMLFFWKTHLKHHLLSYTDSLNMRATRSSFLKCNDICKEFIKCTVHVCVKATRLYLFFSSFVAQIARKTNIVQMVRDIYFATVVCTAILTARRKHVFTSMCVKVLWEMLHASGTLDFLQSASYFAIR